MHQNLFDGPEGRPRPLRRHGVFFLFGLIPILALSACSGGDAPSEPEPEPEPDPAEIGTVGASGGQLQSSDGRVTLQFPTGAVSGNVAIRVAPVAAPVSDPNLVANTAYEFGPSGTQFSEPVALGLRFDASALPGNRAPGAATISKLTNGAWRTIDSDFEVDPSGRVTGSITSFSQYSVTADPCWPMRVGVPVSIDGGWAESDCIFDAGEGVQKYEDIYEVTVTAPQAVRVRGASAGTQLSVGWTTDPGGPLTGAVLAFGRAADAVGFKMLLAPGTYRIWMGREDGAATGDYTFSLETNSADNSSGCGAVGLVAPFTSDQAINAAADCVVTIQFSPFPEVIGKQTVEEYYVFRAEAGRTYTITTSRLGGDDAFRPFPTIFLGGGQVVQYSGDAMDPTKTITFTPSVTRRYTLGVSSTLNQNLDYTQGSYRLSVTAN